MSRDFRRELDLNPFSITFIPKYLANQGLQFTNKTSGWKTQLDLHGCCPIRDRDRLNTADVGKRPVDPRYHDELQRFLWIGFCRHSHISQLGIRLNCQSGRCEQRPRPVL